MRACPFAGKELQRVIVGIAFPAHCRTGIISPGAEADEAAAALDKGADIGMVFDVVKIFSAKSANQNKDIAQLIQITAADCLLVNFNIFNIMVCEEITQCNQVYIPAAPAGI